MKRFIWLNLALLAGLYAQGRLVSVDGHSIFLDCQGTTSGATIVLIAGGGGTTETWNKVQQPISQSVRVCSYDRLGLGRSDAIRNGDMQSVDEIVSDLENLLKAARVEPPYILVGRSIGGLYARAFDRR